MSITKINSNPRVSLKSKGKKSQKMSRQTGAKEVKRLLTHRPGIAVDRSRNPHIKSWQILVIDKAVQGIQSEVAFELISKPVDFPAHFFFES